MVVAEFKGNETTKYVGDVYQYDLGQVLCIKGLNLPKFVEIDFALQETGSTTESEVGITRNGVTEVEIPNHMLINNDTDANYMIYAFVYLTDETSGETIRKIRISVKARSKPENFTAPEDVEIFHEAIKVVNESAERAESAEQKSAKHAEQTKLDAQQTTADRQEVKKLVESVSGIGEQVQAVKEYKEQAQTAATNALLSEQASEQAKEAALQAQAGAETAADEAEQHATEAAGDKTEVERLATQVRQDKTSVEQTVQGFGSTVQQAEQSINTAEEEAVKAVQTEGTTQAGNVSAEGEKQVQAVRGAAQEIVEDRGQIQENKTGIAKLKEDIEQIKSTAYTDTFFKNFFALQRTGKKYTVKFPLWETSQVSTGEKLDNNAGLIIEPSTITEKGRDDYAEIPLFKTYDCNVERINGKLQITAMKGDVNYNAEEKDTFVLGMPYYQKTWVQDGYFYLSRSDVQHEGYILCPEAKKTDGMRSFCLYAKYVSGRNSSKIIGSYKGKAPVRNILSHNGCITEVKKRGEGYCFGSSYDIAYIQNTFLIKYADRDWNKQLGGHFASSTNQFLISKPETGTKRVVLAKANAEKFPIGSSVSVGDLGEDTNKDRANAKIHNICDNVKISDIIEVDVDNKALVLDISENITTTSTTWVTSMHWNSGFSDDIIGRDGCPCKTKSQISSMLYPSVIQGIECMVGGYETLGNAFMDIIDGTHRDVYVCDDSTKLTTDINTAKKNYKKLPKQMTVTKNAQWCYGTNIHIDLENGMNIITQAGESGSGSSTGFCDGIYFDNATTGQREFLLLGGLGHGGVCGAFCSNCSAGLGYTWWDILARLSINVYRGEFA